MIAGALVWLAYELIILIAPSEFRDAQYYVLGALVLGLVVYIVQRFLEPAAMRTETGASGAAALRRRRAGRRPAARAGRPRPGGPAPAPGAGSPGRPGGA